MFVQVVTGKTSDRAALRAQLERWPAELKSGAVGYLGGTLGIADDGTLVGLARFKDAASAAKNSERPEQGVWWEQTAKLLDGEATFRESSDVTLLFDGGSDKATFVQIMEGTITDRAKAESFEAGEMLEQLRSARPDLLGGVRVWLDGGKYVEAAYFTSEADARKNEASAEFAGPQAEYAALFGEMTFTDLRDPLLDTA
jgi:hypothetical protein